LRESILDQLSRGSGRWWWVEPPAVSRRLDGLLLLWRGGKAQIDRAPPTQCRRARRHGDPRAGRGSGSSRRWWSGGQIGVRARRLIAWWGKGGRRRSRSASGSAVANRDDRIFDRPPAIAHFELGAGVSATVHDPAAPTNVRFAFGEGCTDAGIVRLATGSFSSARISRGTGNAIMRIKPGYRYRIRVSPATSSARQRCRRTDRIDRDAGASRCRPAAGAVDAAAAGCGRAVPEPVARIGFIWPAAPASASYADDQSENGKDGDPDQKRPHFVAAGKLAEGISRLVRRRRGHR
jgi:hypothetical protein